MTTFTIHVPGIPRPQGSQKLIHNPRTQRTFTQATPLLAEWRNALVTHLDEHRTRTAWDTTVGPVEVYLGFQFGRPGSHSKKRRRIDLGIKYDGPDIDKLARAVLDALEIAGIVDNDRQVSSLVAEKVYIDDIPHASGAGVDITVRPVEIP